MTPSIQSEAAPASVSRFPAGLLRIRQFQDADLPTIQRLFAEGMLRYAPAGLEHHWVKYAEDTNRGDFADIHGTYMAPGGDFWVAVLPNEDGTDRVVGMVGLERKPGNVGELRRLAVDSQVQRMSIGRRLVEHAEAWAKENGITFIQLDNGKGVDGTLTFYQKLGYTHVDTFPYWHEPRWDAYKLVKQLA